MGQSLQKLQLFFESDCAKNEKAMQEAEGRKAAHIRAVFSWGCYKCGRIGSGFPFPNIVSICIKKQ
jgi:hypothetical protein